MSSLIASSRAYGVRFDVSADDAALLPALTARLPPGARVCLKSSMGTSFSCSVSRVGEPAGGGHADEWLVRVDDELQAQAANETEALDAFEGLVRFEVARRSPRWVFVHAGVVGWRGRAIVIPGFSFSGKSTLVHALVRAGATYYSDEYAVFDHRGYVFPFAQPLSLRSASGTTRRLTAETLGAEPVMPSLPVGVVVSTSYTPGATWQPARLSPAEGVLAILTHTPRAQDAPAGVLRRLARIAGDAPIVAGARGEAAETAEALLRYAACWPFSVEDRRDT